MKAPGLFLALLLTSIFSVAQVERKPAHVQAADSISNNQAVKKMERTNRNDLIQDLDLNREQKIKLKEIRQANKTKKEAVENNSQLSEDEKKKQLRELQKEQARSIEVILTDQQKDKFKAKRRELKKEDN